MTDILIPTNKQYHKIARQVKAIDESVSGDYTINPTCFNASSPVNRNYSLIHATSDIVIMIDDDIWGFFPGWADKLIEPFSDLNVVMVSARLMKTKTAYGVMMDIPLDLSKPIVESPHDMLPSACIAFRNDGTRFDENYIGAGFEDSVTGDMPIFIRDKYGNIKIVPIEDLYCECEDGRVSLSRDIEVWTRNGWSNAHYCYKHTVDKKIYRVRTKNGLICVTGDHSLFSAGKEVKPTDLQIGDQIDLNIFPETGQGYNHVYNPWFDGFFAADGTAGIYYKKHNDKYTQKIVQAKISKHKEHCIDRVCKELGWGKYNFEEKSGKQSYRAALTGKDRESTVIKLIERYYSKNRHKIIPMDILDGSNNVIEEFLNGYTDGDGHIEQRKETFAPRRTWSTKSMALALGIQFICNKLGINTSINTRVDKITINLRENTGNLGTNQTKECINKPPEDDGTVRGVDDVTHLYANKDRHTEVYDINTADGTFVAGLGGIVAHNTDFCRQLNLKYPGGKFLIHNEVKLLHKNEMKNQLSGQLVRNQHYYMHKWGLHGQK